jgi:hypothetical protein
VALLEAEGTRNAIKYDYDWCIMVGADERGTLHMNIDGSDGLCSFHS